MAEWMTTPYVLVPICIILFVMLKFHYERKNRQLWRLYHEQMKQTAIVSKAVMTPNEKEFFDRLKSALPDFEVIPQVAMSALLDVSLPEMHPQYWEMRKRFSQKTVDYVICKKGTMDVVTVVELDDRTHDTKQDKDAARDKMLSDAGIKTVRWDCRAKPRREEIRDRIASMA